MEIEFTPWEPGTDMSGVRTAPPLVAAGHPKAGGMICRNPSEPSYRWYMSAEHFAQRHGGHTHG